jgi:carbonic anhydrase
MEKLILSNKLRVLMHRREGDEPDPPHVDFAGVGAKSLDLLNIDIKIPSEHTVCGRRYDGEMQYYFYHPVKGSLIVIAWLFDAQNEFASNEHLQLVIDEFQALYDDTEGACLVNMTLNETGVTAPPHQRLSSRSDRELEKEVIWDPFHPDIQKTIHFWGYTGSLTEPPCAEAVLWRIMDVPVQISTGQLHQMQNILFNNRDNETCSFTSTHFKGSVARPIADDLRYYKCTRSDYASDAEREICGDDGCEVPFGKNLEPYVDPIIRVTGPPSLSPTVEDLIGNSLWNWP